MNESIADWFSEARYGLFVHFGLYSLLGRGEWVMNKEEIPPGELRDVAERFRPDAFDAEIIADLAVAGGMKYLVFTSMHHEGFRMYSSDLTDFCSAKIGPKRDFVAEILAAARKRGLKVGLYHSLNNWFDQPDAVGALEDPASYDRFAENTLARIGELVARYQPIDILWYDGWWPFDANGWQAERMNTLVRDIQPRVLFNDRNALPGDFTTPEQHLSAPSPWRPWEACVTLNDNWGFHAGDHNWKSPVDIIKMLVRVSQGKGNLLLNIGPRGDGSIPEESVRIIRMVGDWLKINGECIFGTDLCTMDLQSRGDHRGDWCHHGAFSMKGNALYLIASSFPSSQLVLTGLEGVVQAVCRLDQVGGLPFRQDEGKVTVASTGPTPAEGGTPVVFKFVCDRPPAIYKTGGMRMPVCEHPRYDPVTSHLPG